MTQEYREVHLDRLDWVINQLGVVEHDLDQTAATRNVLGVTVIVPNDETPFHMYIRNDLPPDQYLTTVAHELGHIIACHFSPVPMSLVPSHGSWEMLMATRSMVPREEMVANIVASRLLLPDELIMPELSGILRSILHVLVPSVATADVAKQLGVLPDIVRIRIVADVPSMLVEQVDMLSYLVADKMGLVAEAIDADGQREFMHREAEKLLQDIREEVKQVYTSPVAPWSTLSPESFL